MYLLKRQKPFRYGRAIMTFRRLHDRDVLDMESGNLNRFLQMQKRWNWLIDSMGKEIGRDPAFHVASDIRAKDALGKRV